MVDQESRQIAEQAEKIYRERLQQSLELTHLGRFIAIEPHSGEYFSGKTLSEAIQAARRAHPDRLVHTIRVGQTAAVHIGGGRLESELR